MSASAPEEDVEPSRSSLAPSPTNPVSSVPRSNKRRRGSPSASRGVANLTPDQLTKKRANDREAQRAIRERTKTQIETLEKTIHELTSQQPYQELQQVIQQKEAVEAENQDIKRRLLAVLDLVQPLFNGPNPGDLKPSPYSVAPVPSSISSSFPSPTTDITIHNGSFTTSPNLPYPPVHSTQSHPSAPSMPTIPFQSSWQATIVPVSSLTSSSTYVFAPDSSIERPGDISGHVPTQGTTAERPGYGLFGKDGQELPDIGQTPGHRPPLPADSHITLTMSHPQAPIQAYRMPILTDISPVAKTATVKYGPPTCTLDDIILKFLAERELRAREGVPLFELAGPTDPDFSGLLRPERIAHTHPLPRLVTDILSKFPGFSKLPERVAALYITHCVLRWQVAPTQESYDHLPEWVRPIPLQYSSPHPCWTNYVPWPDVRNELVRHQHSYPFDNWFIPFTTSLSLNWPYDDNDTILSQPGSDEWLINPVFEQHVRNLDNWSLGPAFARTHPVLAECVKIKAGT